MNAQEWCAGFYNRILATEEKRMAQPTREEMLKDLADEVPKTGAGHGANFVFRKGVAQVTVTQPDPYLLELARWRC